MQKKERITNKCFWIFLLFTNLPLSVGTCNLGKKADILFFFARGELFASPTRVCVKSRDALLEHVKLSIFASHTTGAASSAKVFTQSEIQSS